MIRLYLIAAAFAAVSVFGAWQALKIKYVHQGIAKEQVRVDRIGEKTDAKAQVAAQVARKKVDREPDAALRKYCRDC